MEMKVMLRLMASVCVWFSSWVSAGDSSCYGYTSTTSHFACGVHGNCVWWAASMRSDLAVKIDASGTSGWSGGQWYDKFNALGVAVGSVPKPGSVVEFSDPGHVAYIEKVNSDGSFDVSEMNYYDEPNDGFVDGVNYATYHPDGNGKYHRNNGAAGGWTLKGFIYPRGISSESDTTCDPTKEKCDIGIQGDIGWFPAVSNCQNAYQWFVMGTSANGEVYPIGSLPDASVCPVAACF